MKCIIILTILSLAAASKLRGYPNIKEFEEEFGKVYTPEDEIEAEKNLKRNEALIEANNKLYEEGKSNFREAVMAWDDLSPEEFLREKTGALDGHDGRRNYGLLVDEVRYNSPEDQERLDAFYSTIDRADLPHSFDARVYGIVTEVKDQGSCGSCSAFAATSQHETCILDKGLTMYRNEMDLSEQQLLDCAYDNYDALGCKGAYIKAYPRWLSESNNGYVHHENHYPYMQDQTTLVCQTQADNIPYWSAGARITGNEYDDYCDDEKLMKLIYTYGSAVTVVYASDNGFRNYKADTVFDTCSNEPVNHAVAAIGWGTDRYGMDYWLIKNSWGKDFGDGGYIKIKRGTCGVASRCAVGKCEVSGSISSVPEKTGHLAATPCDVSAKFPDLTGKKWVYYTFPNGDYVNTRVNCAHGKCSAVDPHKESNTCMILCGRPKCGTQ